MTIFVLDASAVLRFLDTEAGSDRVEEIFDLHGAQVAKIEISAVQWGEIAGKIRQRLGAVRQNLAMNKLARFQMRIVGATDERAVHASELKVDRRISYADAFALDLAMDSPDRVLVTSDYGFKAVTDLAQIEFLPVK